MMNKVEMSQWYFSNGFRCSQAVFVVFSEALGLNKDLALKIATPFGGGFDRGDYCGAYCGALMAIGLKYGSCNTNDEEAIEKTKAMKAIFEKAFNSTEKGLLCKEILGYDKSIPEELEIIKSQEITKEICPKVVERAVEIVEEIFKEHQ
jgi:C_GCAxxG_C_C family probable redox protein